MDKKALGHFRNPYNCAQSVLKAFEETHGVTDAQVEELAACGGGRAEGGACGALYAAQLLVKTPEERAALDEQFQEKAGSLSCHDIRSLKQLDCAGCVQLAARIIKEMHCGM